MNVLNNSNTHQSLCNNIRILRRKNGWKQEDIANLIGINISSYSKIESGITDVNLSRLVQIASIYAICIEELFIKDKEVGGEFSKLNLKALNKKITYREKEIKLLQLKLIELYESVRK